MIKDRDTFVDIAKGIGMLMIVRIHTEVFSTISCPYPIIAVPLFFFLSGFYDNTTKPLKEWLPKSFSKRPF
jgi:fucose 4-O-acetylase-like acetyltransferase